MKLTHPRSNGEMRLLEEIEQAVINCPWREDVHGAYVCTGNPGSCSRIIETHRCHTIKKLIDRKEGVHE